jgi:hypothetical protein
VSKINGETLDLFKDAITALQSTLLIHWMGKSFDLCLEENELARARANVIVKKYPELMCDTYEKIAEGLGYEKQEIKDHMWSAAKLIASVHNYKNEFEFPETCPWSISEMLTDNWMPEIGVTK